MGEMTIRLDDATMIQLEERARLSRVGPEMLVTQLVRQGLGIAPRRDRGDIARAFQALQPDVSAWNSVDFIREDRSR